MQRHLLLLPCWWKVLSDKHKCIKFICYQHCLLVAIISKSLILDLVITVINFTTAIKMALNLHWKDWWIFYAKNQKKKKKKSLQNQERQKSVFLSTQRLLSRNSFVPTVFLLLHTSLCAAAVIIFKPLCVMYANVIFCTVFESSIIHFCFSKRKLCAYGAGT